MTPWQLLASSQAQCNSSMHCQAPARLHSTLRPLANTHRVRLRSSTGDWAPPFITGITTPTPGGKQQLIRYDTIMYLPGASSSSSASSNGASGPRHSVDEDMIWTQQAFPSYLQSSQRHNADVCREFDELITAAEHERSSGSPVPEDRDNMKRYTTNAVWQAIRREAERDAAAEPLLSSFLYASILAHDTIERALAFVLANRLASAVMLPTQLFEIFHEVLINDPDTREGALADVEACRERDPACASYSQALLYYKGFHAIQTHRIAHALWCRGQRVMAVALQSRMSEVLAVDIHPAACIGKGILLDHGTGVVIGETAVIGNNVSLLQNVTLGGTGKEVGDRHPKVSDNVLIGASATVLGNITIGKGAQIAAGSLVLKPVPAHVMMAGSPAKEVGKVTGNPAFKMQQWSRKLLMEYDPTFCEDEPGTVPASTSESTTSSTDAGQLPEQQQQQQQQRHNGATTTSDTNGLPAGQQGQAHTEASASATSSSTSPASSAGASQRQAGGAGPSHASAPAAPRMPAPFFSEWGEPGAQEAARKSSASAPSTSAAAKPGSVPPAGGRQGAESSVGASATATVATAAAAAAAAAQSRELRVSNLKGVYEGDVEATIDEDYAAVKWPDRPDDPEYTI